MKTIAVTGHRPVKIGGYSPRARQKLQNYAAYRVSLETTVGPVRFITGMALGWDQAIAQACVDAKIPWVAAISFKGQEDAWPFESGVLYHSLLAACPEIKYVCEPGYAAWKMQRRNEWMVDELRNPGDFLMALWDGSTGGTANCVEYALDQAKRVVNIWQNWTQFE